MTVVIAAAGFAALMGLLGEWTLTAVDTTARVVAGGLLAIAVLVRETVASRIPVPQVRWQVPRRWMRFYLGGPVVFGTVMGMGVFTRQPSALFHLYLAACVLSADAGLGALLGVVYGTTYVMVFFYRTVAWRHEVGGGQLVHRALAWSERVRLVGALAAPTIITIPAL